MNLSTYKNKNLEFLKEFIDSNLVEKGNSKNTASAYTSDLKQFLNWSENKNYNLKTIDENKLEKYLIYLGKRGYKESSISRKTACLKAFFKFLLKESYKNNNIMKNISRNNKSSNLPKSLSDYEINKIFELIDSSEDKNKLRNKVIFEILYGCGLRVSELINLDIENINFEESQIKCTGKGNKQRIVPTNDNCLKSINDYIELERSIFRAKEPKALFLNKNGRRVTRQTIWTAVKECTKDLNLSIEVTPHTLRHSFATALLKGGANIREVQELLGHSSLSATQIYTFLDNDWIKKEYLNSHPRA
tara:strand:+ start:1911 stop:2822 length:912 start_codon:yes stop_codon:yes gene_type:complete